MSVAVRVIPCLDVDAGRVVKGVNFENLKDAGDPVELAKRYGAAGADELIFLDITASSSDRKTTYEMVKRAADELFIPLTVGGGVRAVADIQRLLKAGADKVSINTSAVLNPGLVKQATSFFGSQCIVVAIDAKARPLSDSTWEVFTHGGRNATGLDAIEWGRRMQDAGAGEILLTSMDQDGTKKGFDVKLTRAMSDALEIPIIASGGVGTAEHFVKGVIDGRADALLAASVFHYGELSVREVKETMSQAGIEVRL